MQDETENKLTKTKLVNYMDTDNFMIVQKQQAFYVRSITFSCYDIENILSRFEV